SLRNAAGPAQVLFEPESRTWSPPPRRGAGKVAATIPASGAGTSRTGNDRFVTQALTGTFANGGADDNKVRGGFLVAIQDVRGGTRHRTDHGQGIGIRVGGPMYTLNATEQHAVAYTLRAEGHDASEDGTGRGTPLVWESRYVRNGRGAPAEIAPALRAENGR